MELRSSRGRTSVSGEQQLVRAANRTVQNVKHCAVQTSVPFREYVGPQARASQAPEFFKQGWMHRPKTVSTLCVTLIVIFITAHLTTGEQSTLRSRLAAGFAAANVVFLVFATLQLPDGILVRPSPFFWRFVKGCSILYLVFLVFLLFQDLEDVRAGLNIIDNSIGIPLPERNYAENCHQWNTVLSQINDAFVLAHFFGWLVKALVIRDVKLLWILSVLFEFMEISFRHILPNFWECWWDHVILDVFGCNLMGIWIGLEICKRYEMKQYCWHEKYEKELKLSNGIGLFSRPSSPQIGSKSIKPNIPIDDDNTQQGKAKGEKNLKWELDVLGFQGIKNAFLQLTPYEWTGYHWPPMLESVKVFTGCVFFCLVVTFLDLNVFFLKAELYMPPSHWIILCRLALMSFAAAAGTREFYDFITDRHCQRMGLQCWLDLAMISTESLLSLKWYYALQPHEPCSTWIWVAWGFIIFGVCLVILYLWLVSEDTETIENEEKQ